MIWVGPINDDFLEKLLGSKSKDLVISTQGGDAFLMTAAIDHLLRYPRRIVATGRCWSAGVPILACGKKRYCTPRTSFMAHKTSTTFGKNYSWGAQDLVREVEQLAELDAICLDVLQRSTALSADAWEALIHKDDFWFDADQAKKMGLIHGIV